MMTKMDNQQLYNLNNNQLQVILSGILGDGNIYNTKSGSGIYSTNCKYEEYIDFKSKLLGKLFSKKGYNKENGYSSTPIHTMWSKTTPLLSNISNTFSIKDILNNLDDLGIALWIYDDGSLHKTKLFYNINTHSFPEKVQKELFIPFFNKRSIFPKVTKEVKKDGRVFYYLRISKFEGSFEITNILKKYPVNCYNYKLWSSETIQEWSKVQAYLKSQGIEVSNKRMSYLLKIFHERNNIQDIVQSLEKSKAGVMPLNN